MLPTSKLKPKLSSTNKYKNLLSIIPENARYDCSCLKIQVSTLKRYLNFFNPSEQIANETFQNFPAEMLILNNIVTRYTHSTETLFPKDVELLLHVCQMNIDSRNTRTSFYMHDMIIDKILAITTLEDFIKPTSLFFSESKEK